MAKFMNLGFVFGAKDRGLGKVLSKVHKGLSASKDAFSSFAQVASSSAKRIGAAMGPLQPMMAKLALTFMDVGPMLAEGLGKAAKVATGGFTRLVQTVTGGTKSMAHGFELLSEAVSTLNKILSINRLATFVDAVSLDKLNDINNKLEQLGKGGRNLTTSLESQMQQATASASKAGFAIGYTGDQLKKFRSKVAGLEISGFSGDAAAKAVQAMDASGDMLKMIGIDSDRTAAKLADLGVNVDELRIADAKMNKQLKLSTSSRAQAAHSYLSLGMTMNDQGASTTMLNAAVEKASMLMSRLGGAFPQKRAEAFVQSTALAGKILYDTTGDTEGAKKAMDSLSQAFVDNQGQMSDMMAGLSSKFPKFSEMMLQAGVRLEDVKGPAEFIQAMLKIGATAKRAGGETSASFNFVTSKLAEQFPDVAHLITNSIQNLSADQLDAAAVAKMSTKVAVDGWGKQAKAAYVGTKTLEDQMQLIEESFTLRFRKIANAGGAFVKDSSKAFKLVGDKLAKLGAEDGPAGDFVRMMSKMHTIGVAALIPDALRPMAAVFGRMASDVAPVAGALGALGFRLSSLVSPFGLVSGAALAMGGYFAKLWMESENVSEAWGKFKTAAPKIWNTVKEKVSSAFNAVLDAGTKATTWLKDHLGTRGAWSSTFDRMFSAIGEAVRGAGKPGGKLGTIFSNLFDVGEAVFLGLYDSLAKVDWGAIATTIGSYLSRAGNFLVDWGIRAVDAFSAWIDTVDFGAAFTGFFTTVGDVLAGTGTSAPDSLASKFGTLVWKAVKAGVNLSLGLLKGAMVGWWNGFFGIWTDDSKSFSDALERSMKGIAATAAAALIISPGLRTKIWDGTKNYLKGIVDLHEKEKKDKLGVAQDQNKGLKENFEDSIKIMQDAQLGVGSKLGGIGGLWAAHKGTVLGTLSELDTKLNIGFSRFPGYMDKARGAMSKVAGEWPVFRELFKTLGSPFTNVFGSMGNGIASLAGKLGGLAAKALPLAAKAFAGLASKALPLIGIGYELYDAWGDFSDSTKTGEERWRSFGSALLSAATFGLVPREVFENLTGSIVDWIDGLTRADQPLLALVTRSGQLKDASNGMVLALDATGKPLSEMEFRAQNAAKAMGAVADKAADAFINLRTKASTAWAGISEQLGKEWARTDAMAQAQGKKGGSLLASSFAGVVGVPKVTPEIDADAAMKNSEDLFGKRRANAMRRSKKKPTEVFSEMAQVAEAKSTGIVAAFRQAYAIVTTETMNFTNKLDDAFTGFAKNLESTFKTTWAQIQTEASAFLAEFTPRLSKAAEDLARVLSSYERARTASAAGLPGAQAKTLIVVPPADVEGGGDEWSKALYNATHNPAWYLDFREQFIGQMSSLRDAVNLKSVPTQGRVTPSRA